MKKFEAYVPVDLRITLDTDDEVKAGDKAGYVADFFVSRATPYLLNLPGIGPVKVELVPLEEDDDDTPEVFEVKSVETLGKLGGLPPQDVSEPFYGACLLPRQPEPSAEANAIATDILLNLGDPSNAERFEKLGGALRGEEWGE